MDCPRMIVCSYENRWGPQSTPSKLGSSTSRPRATHGAHLGALAALCGCRAERAARGCADGSSVSPTHEDPTTEVAAGEVAP
jgi:hypothetical protein